MKLGYRSLGVGSLRVSALGLLLYAGFTAGQSQKNAPDYLKDVQPIFKARCSPCHTDGGDKGGLKLDSYADLMKSGDSGAMFVPGNPEKSELMVRIVGSDGGPQMPKGFKPLSANDLKLISDWIKAGGKNSTSGPVKHWAYVPPVRPTVPVVKDGGWSKNEIDRFVYAGLMKAGMKPSPQADKVTLLRRLSLDLIGLPPTPAEVDAFMADKTPGAYEKAVDRLLANPHFGERMALPWLDAARYADSNGFQQDGDTYQYVWRDWVVRAFNSDKPYDQFTIEQLAGDLLPGSTLDQKVATGFNRNHMLNGEGGAIAEEQRNVILFDRVDTTSTTWMGLTMACARCHDHKYDPLTQRDYYSMMAFFNNVPETGVPPGGGQYRIADPWVYAGSPEEMKAIADAESKLKKATERQAAVRKSPEFALALDQWRKGALLKVAEAKAAQAEFGVWNEVGVFSAANYDEAFAKEFGPEKSGVVTGKAHPEWTDGKSYALNGDATAFYLARTIKVNQEADFLFSIGSDDGVKVFFNGRELASDKGQRAAVPDTTLLNVRLKKGENHLLIKIVNNAGIGGFYFKAFAGGFKDEVLAQLDQPAKVSALFAMQVGTPESKKADEAVRAADRNLNSLKSKLPQVMVMSDAMPRKTRILSRGNYEAPLDEVSPAWPKVLGASTGAKPNRLDLAKWMVSPANPLTARVEVNRIWQTLFGTGLVKTSENFGVQGEAPVNQALLDWLSVDFRESGWRIKRLIKQIVMSSTYRQSSKVTKEMLAKDPENQHLGRGARFRLASPLIRDVALASSGLLEPKIGGKPVYPYQPAGIWDGLAITKERDFTYPQSKGADNYRRSLYTFWRRTAAPGNMFDTANRQACTVRASRTSTPLHALTMLNDVTWVEAGRALAQKILPIKTPETRMTEAFRRVCARRPKPDELAILMRSVNKALTLFKANPALADEFLKQGDLPLDPKINKPELAAYAAACQAIFNLDEAMTRE